MSSESEELKALSFIRRSLLRKNDKIRELTKQVASLNSKVETLQWRCNNQEKEIVSLRGGALATYRGDVNEEEMKDGGSQLALKGNSINSSKQQQDDSIPYCNVKPEADDDGREGSDGCYMQQQQQPDDNIVYPTEDAEIMPLEQQSINDTEESQIFAQETNEEPLGDFDQHQYFQQPLDLDVQSRLQHSRLSTLQAAGSGGSPQNVLGRVSSQAGVSFSKAHSCALCGASFNRQHCLRRHLRTHTGERPYRCTHCTRTFSDGGNLKRHVARHLGIRPHCCPHCSKAFAEKYRMNLHVRLHHRDLQVD